MESYQLSNLSASVARPALRHVRGAPHNGTKKKEKSLNVITVRTGSIKDWNPPALRVAQQRLSNGFPLLSLLRYEGKNLRKRCPRDYRSLN